MTYTVTPTPIADLLILEPRVFGDERGFFMESYNLREFERTTGLELAFVQDNHSLSRRGVLRGLHYQQPFPQGKLVRVVRGEVFDVAVDLRKESPTFGKHVGVFLSAKNHRQLWVPEGFAHGFLVTSDWAEFVYKATDYYHPEAEHTIVWNDPTLRIEWPLNGAPTVAEKDARGVAFTAAKYF